MTRRERRQRRVDELISDFPSLVAQYDRTTPFNQTGQIELHQQTITIRRGHSSPTDAIADHRFIRSLYATLKSWGIGTRASVLVPEAQFHEALREWSPILDSLDEHAIDDPALDRDQTADALWRLITGIEIVENKSKLVALSKTLHHILPDLLPPIDRAYTQRFFLWQGQEFQNDQERVFRSMWHQFTRITDEVDLDSFVGSGWKTSKTKVIDNAIIAYVQNEAPASASRKPASLLAPSPARLAEIHSVSGLYAKLSEFEAELSAAGLKSNTVDTYVRRSKTFVDWLAGRYVPRGPNSP